MLSRNAGEGSGPSHRAYSGDALLRGSASKAVLLFIILAGAALRCRGFSNGGLWRDDAWVALSTRVGIGTAWHMWVTAPGFYLLEHGWMVLHPGSTWWAQIPPFVMGVTCIPVMYAVARYFKLDDWIALVLALVVCVSPICTVYSTRLKQYQADFLLACLLLVVAEAFRRRPSRRNGGIVVLATVCSFAISASTITVAAGVWLAMILSGPSRREMRRPFVGAACAGAGSLLVAAALYAHLSPTSARGWHNNFITHSNPLDVLSSSHRLLLDLYVDMFGTSVAHPLESALVFLIPSGLVLLALRTGRAAWSPALVIVAAIGASALRIIPLGGGRTDVILYPALLVLMGFGLQAAGRILSSRLRPSIWRQGAFWLAGVIATFILLIGGVSNAGGYPTTDTRTLAADISHHLRPGDHVVVGELMRYPWALYEDSTLRLEFGSEWSAGFTVVSTQPNVFIAPSEVYEVGSTPGRWATQMGRYRRLWFVETDPLSLNPLYASLRAEGWRPVETLKATGCSALLLTRS